MVYKAVYCSKEEPKRDLSITYCVTEENGHFYIESYTNGGKYSEKAFLGICKEQKADSIARLLAKKSVHPLHIEDIISDMRF